MIPFLWPENHQTEKPLLGAPIRVLQSTCAAQSQCSALQQDLTSLLVGSLGLAFAVNRFLEGSISSTKFGKANDLGKQACLTRTCVGVAVNCKHIPMCGLHGELYSGVIHRQKGRSESEMTTKSIIRPRPAVHVCPVSGTTMLGLLTKALHPANIPELVGIHVEISSNDLRHAIRVREIQEFAPS